MQYTDIGKIIILTKTVNFAALMVPVQQSVLTISETSLQFWSSFRKNDQ